MSLAIIGWMVGGAGVLAGSAGTALYRLTVMAQRPRLLPNETNPPVPYDQVEWQSGGKTVKGWFLPQFTAEGNRASMPVIIIAHGWGSNRSRVLRYALPLHEEGYAILMYDARSHGESDFYKTPTGLQFRDDLLAALKWLKASPDMAAVPIGVLGHSLGAFAAVLALDVEAPIAALVTDSMPVRFATMIGAELKRRRLPQFPLAQLLPRLMVWRSGISSATMKRANPARILQNNASSRHIPVLMVHSRKDGFIPPTELNHVLSRTPNLPHLFVDADGHSASERDPAFWPAVKGFFQPRPAPRGPPP